ncbi:hypothetical protein [Brachybacterium sp. ACRRE]|uniref:hypothetical protein n=1 Tax=Brachybacterium sp. ACRRE TaxID=2918184 RepID=UPI001EF1CF38|nr:hypothetical protein [Brachybacterium sp. ACRRE]MCG7310129.1 hypothetical protein [Brachybacterium sp. ACRRE]
MSTASTCARPTIMLTPWCRRLMLSDEDVPRAAADGSTAPTPILDHRSAAVTTLVDRARDAAVSTGPRTVLQAAHRVIATEISPVYALDETVPASRIIARGTGSCSQRLAVLESVARAIGVRTRVRALLIDASFWYDRFGPARWVLPDAMLLVWPELELASQRYAGTTAGNWADAGGPGAGWTSAAELFGSIGCRGGAAFTNTGSETLFEAAGRCAIDWDGRTDEPDFDLSGFVRHDYGRFTDRDEAFALLGQTLCAPSRRIADPVMRRVSA